MKKALFIVFVTICSYALQSQNLSYGLVFSSSYYHIYNGKGLLKSGVVATPPIGMGIYADYNIKNKIGIKTLLTYNSITESYSLAGNQFRKKQKNVSVIPHFKYSLNNNYKKGLYLISGPRISIILNEKDVRNNAPDGNLYKKVNLGAQVGFGLTFFKHFILEAVGDYGLSNPLKANTRSQTLGIVGNLIINLESFLKN